MVSCHTSYASLGYEGCSQISQGSDGRRKQTMALRQITAIDPVNSSGAMGFMPVGRIKIHYVLTRYLLVQLHAVRSAVCFFSSI